jgi:hypothetical protein
LKPNVGAKTADSHIPSIQQGKKIGPLIAGGLRGESVGIDLISKSSGALLCVVAFHFVSPVFA